MSGIAITLVILWALWMARGKLNSHGLEFLAWRATPTRPILMGIAIAISAALVVSGLFRNARVDSLPRFTELWMGVTLGPVVEELIFRGYMFSFLRALLARWHPAGAGWITVAGIAAAFAAAHLAKPEITPAQIASIFAMGCLYGWLRLSSGSTVPSTAAHVAYNAVIYGVAALRAR
jgi:membrane protease YdiL (CAAX protease family)